MGPIGAFWAKPPFAKPPFRFPQYKVGGTKIIDIEYDRANVPPYNGNDPPPAPGSLKRSLFPTLFNEVHTKQGNARGTSEVRRGTSSNHFHCPVPRSSSHIGPRNQSSLSVLSGTSPPTLLRSLILPPLSPFRPCPLCCPFSPLHLPLYPPFWTPSKLCFGKK